MIDVYGSGGALDDSVSDAAYEYATVKAVVLLRSVWGGFDEGPVVG